jgi:hypothetical protein
MLLDGIDHFHVNGDEASFMLGLTQYPFFKNFTLSKLKDFSIDIFPKKIIRVNTSIVREVNSWTFVGKKSIGLSFRDLSAGNQKVIASYVDTFLSNIVHLLSLIDMINYDEESLLMVRELSEILGYPYDVKISVLRQLVTHHYRSLQWL